MSIEKVVRYELASHQIGFGTEAFPVESSTGRYIEYADVAGLVEALHRAAQSAGFQYMTYETRDIIDNELARWTL